MQRDKQHGQEVDDNWTKIDPQNLSSVIKKINKSSLKLDQLI